MRGRRTKDRDYKEEAQLYADELMASVDASAPALAVPSQAQAGAIIKRSQQQNAAAAETVRVMQESAKRGNKGLKKSELMALLMLLDPAARELNAGKKLSLPEVNGRLRVAMIRRISRAAQDGDVNQISLEAPQDRLMGAPVATAPPAPIEDVHIS